MTIVLTATVDDFPPDVIDAWRQDGTLDEMIKAGAILDPAARVDLVERAFFNPYHDHHSGRFAPKPGGGTQIGVTPNRGQPKGSLDEIQPYFGTTRYKGFERHAREDAPAGVKVLKTEKAGGFWEGGLEPSATVTVQRSTSKAALKDYATGLGRRYNQDGVVAFTPRKGGIQRRYRWRVNDPAAGVKALRDAGVMGATVRGNTLEVVDLFGSEGPKMKSLGTLLGHRGQITRGDGILWEKGVHYSAIMRAMVVDTRARRPDA
jgi:hypothetical protein